MQWYRPVASNDTRITLATTQHPSSGPAPCCAVRFLLQAASELFEGWHVALYVADFSRTYGAIENRGLTTNDHPYRCAGLVLACTIRHVAVRKGAVHCQLPAASR